MVRILRQMAALLFSTVLVLGNLLMLLPRGWTLMQFTRQPVMMFSPELRRSESDHQALILEDITGVSRGPGSSPEIPIRIVQERLRAKQTRSLIRVASIHLTFEPSDPAQPIITRSYKASQAWQPISEDGLQLRFLLPHALDMPPGAYTITAKISAPFPSGDDFSQVSPELLSQTNVTRAVNMPVWPGTAFLVTTETPSLTITVPRSADSQ